MKKIVVVKNLGLSGDQIKRLKSLGNLTMYNTLPNTPEEWLERCNDADVICTGREGLSTDKLYELSNVLIAIPFVGVEFVNKNQIMEKNIVIANTPGCNKEAVTEWIISMMLSFFRHIPELTRAENITIQEAMKPSASLCGKNITILGRGNIGSTLGKICGAFGMNVTIFKRGDNLIETIKDADVVVNCLSTNPTTEGLLDKKFFNSLKKGSFFVSITPPQIYNIEALFDALDKGILSGAADDAGGALVGNVKEEHYQKLFKHPKILVTPHIAWHTDYERLKSNNMMIDNIEAWLKGKPINLI